MSGLLVVRTGSVAVAMPWAKWRSRIWRGVSRVRIAVLRTSSSEPSVGLYASRRRLASSTSTERSRSALSCSTRAWTSSSRGGICLQRLLVVVALPGPQREQSYQSGGHHENTRLDPQRAVEGVDEPAVGRDGEERRADHGDPERAAQLLHRV